MFKSRILRRKCAALLLLLHCLVATPVQLFREKVQHQCSSFSSLIRRIFSLNGRVFTSRKCSSSSTLPDFSQENNHLSEEVDNSPSDGDFHNSWEFGDEYDEFDYDCWLDGSSDDEWDWDYEPEGYLSEEDYDDWLAHHDAEAEAASRSWEEQAVNDAIDDEQPGEYPPGFIGDIPF